MIDRSNWNEVFEASYEIFFIKPSTLSKIKEKHSVYLDELKDALDDPCWIIRKNKRKEPKLPGGKKVEGVAYDIFCETSDGRVLKVIGRLYNRGRFQVITVINENEINNYDMDYYINEKELICHE